MRIEQEARTDPKVENSDRELSKAGEQEALEDSFFSEPPPPEPVDTFWDLDSESDDEDDIERVRNSRRAMIVTFFILGVAVIGIGSYTVYAKVLMPTPVAMGAVTSLPDLPQPIYSDSQTNKHRFQGDRFAEQKTQARSPEQQMHNAPSPTAAEQAQALPVETGAIAQEQETAETEQSAATESQTEPAAQTNSTTATTEPPLEDLNTTDSVEDINTAEKDNATAQPPTTQPTPEAVAVPAQTAAKTIRRRVKRRRAAVGAVSSAKPASDYKAIVKRANALYRNRKTRDQAIAEYNRALTLNPNGGEALRKLSYYHLNQGRSNEAEQFAARAVRVNPNNSQSWFLLGAARDARNNPQGAQEAYRGCAQGKGAYATRCQALIR